MPDKMNLEYLKLLYCEFQKYKVMAMSVEDGQQKNKKTKKNHANPSYKATERTFLITDYYKLINIKELF